jgi:hypothetical protein
MKSRYSIVLFSLYLLEMLRKFKRHHQTLDKRKSFFAFNQSTQQTMAWGGTSNMAGNFGINYDFNYKGAVVWDKFILAYGLSKIKGDSKTADDRLD